MNLTGRLDKRMPFHIDDSEISKRLQSIREALGMEMGVFHPNRSQIVDVVISANEVETLFNRSGLLVRDSRPVFAYIRDHTEKTQSEWDNLGGPEGMKKLHFAVCKTLVEMKERGRFERYRVTNVTNNMYEVDTREGKQQVPLYPCQNCLNKVGYRCFSYQHTTPAKRLEIVREFNSQEAMDLLWQWFDLFRSEVASLQNAHSPTGYTANWRRIAKAFKQKAGWKCASCGILLERHRRLLDVHHVNGDKRKNSDDNLRCLCKECHCKEHHHYHVPSDDLWAIQQEREQYRLEMRDADRHSYSMP